MDNDTLGYFLFMSQQEQEQTSQDSQPLNDDEDED